MAITLVGAETVGGDTRTFTVDVPRPAGYASGDVALAFACVDDIDALQLPSGFTELHNESFSGDARFAVGYKVMGASEPSAYTFNKEDNQDYSLGIAVFRGVNNTTPIDTGISYNSGEGPDPTAPGMTTTTPNAAVIAAYGHENAAAGADGVPSGFTLVATQESGADSPTGASFGAAFEIRATVSGSGDLVFSTGDDDTWGAVSFSLMDENESPPPKTADGDLAAAQAAMDGSGVAFTIITGSGQPDASRARLGATGDNITTVYVDGAMQAETAVVDGSADRFVFAAGALAADAAEVAADGVRRISLGLTFVAVQAGPTGVAERIVTGAGPIEASRADMDADGIRIGDSQGQMEAQPVTMLATSEFKRNAGGSLTAGASALTSASKIAWKLSPALSAGQAVSDATTQIFTGHTAAGDMQARPAEVAVTMRRGVNSTINLRAEDAVLYMVTWLRQDRDDNVWKDLEGGHWVAKN